MDAIYRRREHLTAMDQGASQGMDCASCPGHCCTFRANSMQITPLETQDILEHLKAHGLWDEALKTRLRECISEFRLNQEQWVGARALRRNYTCPFFKNGSLGCSLPREVKPYGCLAFNPGKAGEESGASCSTDPKAWERREQANAQAEDVLNLVIKNRAGLTWAKSTIPVALLDLENTDNTAQALMGSDR